MAEDRKDLTPEKMMALSPPRRGPSGVHMGIYAMLILLAVGELHMLNRIGDMRNYVDQRDQRVQAEIEKGFQKKLSAAEAAQATALESATRRIEGRLSHMQGRAQNAQANADQAAKRLEKMQAAEDTALSNIQNMLAQKASTADIRALTTQIAQTHSDVDLAGAQLAQLHAQVVRFQRANNARIVDLNKRVAAIRRASFRFVQFTLVRNRSKSVGGIAMVLTKTRRKNSRFDLRLAAKSTHLERKDVPAGAPIFFVPGSPQQTYEVVVNYVGNNEVHGFLGAPAGTLSAAAKARKIN